MVFGSYLSEQDKINDIDIGVALERKTTDRAVFEEMFEQCIRQAEQGGRHFGTHVERIFWPEREIQHFMCCGIRKMNHIFPTGANQNKGIQDEERKIL